MMGHNGKGYVTRVLPSPATRQLPQPRVNAEAPAQQEKPRPAQGAPRAEPQCSTPRSR